MILISSRATFHCRFYSAGPWVPIPFFLSLLLSEMQPVSSVFASDCKDLQLLLTVTAQKSLLWNPCNPSPVSVKPLSSATSLELSCWWCSKWQMSFTLSLLIYHDLFSLKKSTGTCVFAGNFIPRLSLNYDVITIWVKLYFYWEKMWLLNQLLLLLWKINSFI